MNPRFSRIFCILPMVLASTVNTTGQGFARFVAYRVAVLAVLRIRFCELESVTLDTSDVPNADVDSTKSDFCMVPPKVLVLNKV